MKAKNTRRSGFSNPFSRTFMVIDHSSRPVNVLISNVYVNFCNFVCNFVQKR